MFYTSKILSFWSIFDESKISFWVCTDRYHWEVTDVRIFRSRNYATNRLVLLTTLDYVVSISVNLFIYHEMQLIFLRSNELFTNTEINGISSTLKNIVGIHIKLHNKYYITGKHDSKIVRKNGYERLNSEVESQYV